MAKALLLDLSGVLYDGDVLLPGALEAVRRVQGSDLEVRFITNTSQKTRVDLLAHLRGFGFSVEEPQLFTAVDAARQWLQQRDLRPFCLVHENIRGEFDDFEQDDPNAVLIADAADGFSYANLNRAFQLCLEGAPLLGVGYNRYFKSGGEVLMDVGAFIVAVEFAAGIKATIVGKPSPEFFHQVLASTSASAEHALMVGDDVFGDVEGALNAGLPACLVRTGKYRPGDEARIDGDFALVDSVAEAVELALAAA
ncbi:MAG: TIGR01458 family HAD-type hydrolase [Haliea sp.]|jgi:HAD superfamily hydrolase (TIGR01458 family)|nr:TIGR01458 family HAD-type hydrolase [Haliea sp.]